MDNFDEAYLDKGSAAGYFDKNGKRAPVVVFSKKIDGSHVVVEAACDGKKNRCYIITEYIAENGVDAEKMAKSWHPRDAYQSTPAATSETETPVTSPSSVYHAGAETVNEFDIRQLYPDMEQPSAPASPSVLASDQVDALLPTDQRNTLEQFAGSKGLQVQYINDPDSPVSGSIQGNTMTINLGNGSYALGTAIHEVGHAMKAGDGKAFAEFQAAVLRLADADPSLRRVAAGIVGAYLGDASPARASMLNEDGSINRAALNEEVALKLAEELVQDPEQLIRTVSQDRTLIARFLDFVRKIKNSVSIRFTGSQKAMLDEAERTLENMLRGQADTVENRRFNADSRYNSFKPFAQQVDDALAGKIPVNTDLLVGATPEVLQRIGLNALPMTMTAKHAQTTYRQSGSDTSANYHGLGEMLKQLPEALADPVAVIRSETKPNSSVVVLVELIDQQGNTVVAPVVVDGKGRMNGVTMDANVIASAYGKRNAVSGLLKKALDAESQGNIGVYYINKNKAMSPSLGARVQFPGDVHGLDGFIHSIRESESNVNNKLDDATKSRQFKRWFGDWQGDPQRSSKITNTDGTPKVVYHGTNQQFNTFSSDNSAYWFSESQDYAEAMMEERNGNRMIPAYLNMRNPYYATLRPGEFTDPAFERDILDAARANGHDGAVIENSTENELEKDRFYVVFSPNQIKSAEGNIGTFDGSDGNIYHSLRTSGGVSLDGARTLDEYIARKYGPQPAARATPAAAAPASDAATAAVTPTTAEETAQALERTAKSRSIQRRQESQFVRELGDLFGIPEGESRARLRQLTTQLADQRRTTGRIDPALADSIFEEAYQRGRVIDERFLNIGTNDMNGPDYALPALLEAYGRILAGIRAGAPGAALWLLDYYPVCPEAARDDWARQALRWRTNRRIDEANAALPALAERWGARSLRMGDALRDETGGLRPAYTLDGIHLFPDAYWQVWQALLPTLRGLT